jgi:hypothetical protein
LASKAATSRQLLSRLPSTSNREIRSATITWVNSALIYNAFHRDRVIDRFWRQWVNIALGKEARAV